MKPNESPQESPQEASPFPPAFRWDASPSEAPTRVMSALGRDGAPLTRAQVAPVPRTDEVGDCDRTEVMQAIPATPRRPDGAQDLFHPAEPPRDELISGTSDASAPPWGEDPLPIAEQQSAWLRQGSGGGFATPAGRLRSTQVIGIAVLAVVVVGLVGSAVAYFLTPGPGRINVDQIAAPAPTPRDLPAPPAPLAPPVDTVHALSDPPGQLRGGGGSLDLPQLQSTGLLPRPILKALQAGGMTDGVLKTTTIGTTTIDTTTIGMFALTLPDQQAATTVAQMIATAQLEGGLKADDSRALQGVEVMGSAPGSDVTVYRAVYVLYNRAIFVEVFGPKRDRVLATFDSLIKQQLSYAPPTVRAGR